MCGGGIGGVGTNVPDGGQIFFGPGDRSGESSPRLVRVERRVNVLDYHLGPGDCRAMVSQGYQRTRAKGLGSLAQVHWSRLILKKPGVSRARCGASLLNSQD